MQWIIENWVLVLLGGGMIGMHLFGHGKHGSGGGRGCCGPKKPGPKTSATETPEPDGKIPGKPSDET